MIRTITIVVSVILVIRIVYYLIFEFHRKNGGAAVREGSTTHETRMAEDTKLKRVQQPRRDESVPPRWNLRKPIQCAFWEKLRIPGMVISRSRRW